MLGETAATNKVMTICYALGWTQHSVGSQNIRTMAMIQLLLGNMGRPGGGINWMVDMARRRSAGTWAASWGWKKRRRMRRGDRKMGGRKIPVERVAPWRLVAGP